MKENTTLDCNEHNIYSMVDYIVNTHQCFIQAWVICISTINIIPIIIYSYRVLCWNTNITPASYIIQCILYGHFR